MKTHQKPVKKKIAQLPTVQVLTSTPDETVVPQPGQVTLSGCAVHTAGSGRAGAAGAGAAGYATYTGGGGENGWDARRAIHGHRGGANKRGARWSIPGGGGHAPSHPERRLVEKGAGMKGRVGEGDGRWTNAGRQGCWATRNVQGREMSF